MSFYSFREQEAKRFRKHGFLRDLLVRMLGFERPRVYKRAGESVKKRAFAVKLSHWIKRIIGEQPQERDVPDDVSNIDLDDPFRDPIEIEITDVFDLHTIPPRDVKRVVEEYLWQAHEKGFSSVRIIHGKGIGVQRQTVRSILERTPFVLDWVDAPPAAGGLGATIVRLK
jgi:dsDNA-specific endonuclease/ATPase MutS2